MIRIVNGPYVNNGNGHFHLSGQFISINHLLLSNDYSMCRISLDTEESTTKIYARLMMFIFMVLLLEMFGIPLL